MVRRLWPANQKLRIAVMIGAAVILLAAALMIAKRDSLPKLQTMNIKTSQAAFMPVAQGEEWKAPALSADGFAAVADNGKFELLVDPKTSQIAVRSKQNGYLWRSNPAAGRLSKETVKGTLLENLQSPFILEYTSGTDTKRSATNARDPKLTMSYKLGKNGIQVAYTFTSIQLSFVVQYALTDRGLEVAVPSEGIQETGSAKIYALNVLPFFGAVSEKEEQGYLFVPDGPGGLIYYDRKRPAIGNVYEFPIYGKDQADMMASEGRTRPREQISYPVFGLKRGDQAFAAIVKDGQYSGSVRAVLPGNISTYHTISANFSYRKEYGRKVSGITKELVNTIQKDRVHEDRRVEYRLLSGKDADYAGMANAYRSYLEENGMLNPPLEAASQVPLQLSITAGASKPKFGGEQYEAATTFKQAEQMANDLMRQGVANIKMNIQGWQNSGHAATDDRFPIPPSIGGNGGAKQFVSAMHEKGVKVMFVDYVSWRNTKYSSFYVKTDGIRGIDSTVLMDKFGRFLLNPVKAVRGQKAAIDRLKEIGADGIHYIEGPGKDLFSDYNPDSPLSRKDTASYYSSLLDYSRRAMGMAGVFRGNDYSLAHADYVEELPSAPSYDLIVDETVPFYPMVVHGTVEYTFTAGNLRDDYDAELLRAIEYGAVPHFKLTYSPSRVLKDTDYDFIYSSEFSVWKDRVVEEYRKFNQLAAAYNQRMTNHEKVAERVYRTTYANGMSVTVDYNTNRFSVAGGGTR